MVGAEVVQVRCNTCGGTHRYRTAEPTPRKATSTRRKTRAKAKPSVDKLKKIFLKRLAEKDTSAAQDYSPRLNPKRGDVLRHTRFGLGIVERVAEGKAAVTFEVGEKLLVVGR